MYIEMHTRLGLMDLAAAALLGHVFLCASQCATHNSLILATCHQQQDPDKIGKFPAQNVADSRCYRLNMQFPMAKTSMVLIHF